LPKFSPFQFLTERAIWEPMASECVHCIAEMLCVVFST